MSTDVTGLFAEIRSALEDIHAIAVEGQDQGLSPDIQWALLRSMRTALQGVHRTAKQIVRSLGGPE